MYFKNIDLHGFKSFADRTEIALEPGITAIVGPNGCGKSNILDALRWALGEQSAKALRGSHMQDVIFNGSEHRSPTGMAEVKLVFDNADSKLPVDFAEVNICRRVYRSGESEYLMNNAPCRLRDIQELFMDTGIGTSAYSLIGQGKIDMVLSSKPDDRRYLFEEAAGIIKYKTRKRVAMRKLESADQNLVRLADIIAEVERQMRSLKRQVNAAIRHRELSAQLKELEVRQAWLQYNELSGAISDLKEQFAEAQERYEKASTETSTQEARLEELSEQRAELERTLMARREGEYQVDSEMEKMESRVALLRRDIEHIQQQREQALKEHEELTARASGLEGAQQETAQRAEAARNEIQQLQNEVGEKQQAYTEAAEHVARVDEDLEALRAQALEKMSTRNKTQTELETIGVNVSHIDAQLETVQQQEAEEGERFDALTAELQEAQRTQREQEQALEGLQAEREQKQAAYGETNAHLKSLNEQWQQVRETKSSQDARLRSLRELRDSYEGFAAGVKAVMQARQEGLPQGEGIIGPVGDLISTGSTYEQAIEAALGGNINNVIVETAEVAKSAIAYLKENQAGRVTFLPLDTIRPGNHDNSGGIQNEQGYIGRAVDLVNCEDRLRPAIEYLLYNTALVETIDDAIRIARSGKRYPRLVTLEGEVIAASGAVTGGRTKHESRGLLGRAAEIDDLERESAAAEERIRALAEEAQTATKALETLEGEIRNFEQREAQCRKELNDAGVAVARLTTELDNLKANRERMTEQREKLFARRQELEAQRGSAMEKVSSMESDDEALQAKISEAQEAAAAARQALAARGDELSDARVRLAERTQSAEEAERNLERERRSHAEALEEAQKRLTAIEALKTREQESEKEVADNLERMKALSESKDEAHKKVLQAQEKQQGVVDEIEKLNKSLKQLREKTNALQKEVHRLELDLSHKEDRVEFFQERIRSEYDLTLSSLTDEDVGTDEHDEDEREHLIAETRRSLQRLGTVNLMAIDEYEALEKRHEFLLRQEEDLRKARETLMGVVERIDTTILEMFMQTFRDVGENFKDFFRRLFNGGQARIYLLDEDDPLESGIEIEARPPGKKPQSISLLSGGEQAMTAIALLFSIFKAKPSPFCVLDEVDAPLDDANIGRFLGLLDEFVDRSQFIIITHNKRTMSHADALYGVTQQERGVSQLVSVKFDEAERTSDAA